MSNKKVKAWIGADVGKKGAIALLFENGLGGPIIHSMPMLKGGKEYDLPRLIEMFENFSAIYSCQAVIEDVHSIYGASAKSNFQFGVSAGILKCAVAAASIPFRLVSPKTWQAVCFEGVPPIVKSSSRAKGRGAYDNKAMALIAASRLYPKQSFRRTLKCSTPDDGMVDALLIAHYCKQTF